MSMEKRLEDLNNSLIRAEQAFEQTLDLARLMYHSGQLDEDCLGLVEDLFEALGQDL